MIISHWGIFPGWFRQRQYANGSYRLGDPADVWEPIDFETFCLAIEVWENDQRDMDAADAAAWRKAGRLH